METQSFRIDISQLDEAGILKSARFFGVLADITRIKILSFLIDGEKQFHEIKDFVGLSKPAISYQLTLLTKHDILRFDKRGRNKFFRLADNHVLHILRDGIRHMSGHDPCDNEPKCEDL
jgi:DNA-binding transcriptional ArsR family regulator